MSECEPWQRPLRGTSFSGLGPLEADILVATWDHGAGGATAREIHDELLTQREVAYGSVCLVLKNLVRKGMLVRDRQKAVFTYRAAVAPAVVRDEVLDAVVAAFYRSRAAAAVAQLLGLPGPLDDRQFEQLRRQAEVLQSR